MEHYGELNIKKKRTLWWIVGLFLSVISLVKVVEASANLCRHWHCLSLYIPTSYCISNDGSSGSWLHWFLQTICCLRMARNFFWCFSPSILLHGMHLLISWGILFSCVLSSLSFFFSYIDMEMVLFSFYLSIAYATLKMRTFVKDI